MNENPRKREVENRDSIRNTGGPRPPPLPMTAKRRPQLTVTQIPRSFDWWRHQSPKTVWLVTSIGTVIFAVLAILLFLQFRTDPKNVANISPLANGESDIKSGLAIVPPSVVELETKQPSPRDDSTAEPSDGPQLPVVSRVSEIPHETSSEEPRRESNPSDSEPTLKSKSSGESLPVSSGTPVARPRTSSGQSIPDLDELIDVAASLVKSAKADGAIAKLKEATATLRKASNLYQKDLRGDFYLGILHSGIGINDPKTAEFHFQRALERSPNHAATLNNLVLVAVKARKFPMARNYLKILADASPRPFETNQNLGRLISQARLLSIKSDELKRITNLNTQPAIFRADLGWIYMPLDSSEKSRMEYKGFCRDGGLEDPSCVLCNGYGSLPCKTCGREGTVLVMGSMSGTTTTMFGSVNTATPTTGTARCAACGGDGRVDCECCQNGTDPSLNRR